MIETAFCISLMVYFLKASLWKGMIFEKIHNKLKTLLPEKLYKPFVGCPVCMTPYWGFLIYTVGHFGHLQGFERWYWLHIIYILFIASGINTVILMLNKEYDVAIKKDKILKKEMNTKNIKQ